ncbi:MAG: response regulator [Ilumatobacteraceae bacterium]
MRALIVDDHCGFRAVARVLLERAGHVVVGEASDGASTIEAVHRLDPDLVLLDIQLPDCDGFTIADQLAQHTTPPVVVLVTARRLSTDRGRAERSPVRGLLLKESLTVEALDALLGVVE